MSKKNFKTSFDELLGDGSAKPIEPNVKKESHEETRSTFVIRCDHLDKLRAVSYLERKMIKNVLEEALSLYLEKYESENGEVILPKN